MARLRTLPLAALLLCGLLPQQAEAHFGAPYPVLVDQPVGPYRVSALADPDVGVGTFTLQVTLADGNPLPAGTTVTLWVWPEDGHLSPYSRPAQREEGGEEERFVAEVPFDAEGPWQVRLEVEGPAGRGEVIFPLQVTPPGPGWATTLLCLLPFIALGGVWGWSVLRKQERG